MYRSIKPVSAVPMISVMKVEKLVRHGCEVYLSYVVMSEDHKMGLSEIPVVCEFLNVFPDELLGLPTQMEIDFSMELMRGTQPISKTPYRMAPNELKELKMQLQELIDKGFIQPSTSPWGALVSFRWA